jgi:hypothetical protein
VTTNVPNRLLRAFRVEDHARDFLEGNIRFGLLDYYKKIEDVRRDTTEGLASFYWDVKAPQVIFDLKTDQITGRKQSDQNIHYSGSSINPYFILSTFHPDVDMGVLRKYGEFFVRISDPQALLDRIKIAWRDHAWSLNGSAWIAQVVYNKNEILEPDLYLRAPASYSYAQKPRIPFEEDREFRYVLECSIDADRVLSGVLTLTLPTCRDICSLF